MNRLNIVVVVLSALLLLAVGYIGYNFYSDAKLQEQMEIYQTGAQVGYEQAVSQMFQLGMSCQQIPLTVENQTMNLIAVECLQQAEKQVQLEE